MSTRSEGIKWLSQNFAATTKNVYVSKYYSAEESWSKKETWWIQIPIDHIESSLVHEVHLLCQKAKESKDFWYLKVPVPFLIDNLKEFHIVKEEMVSLYISPLKDEMFKEVRGSGKVTFNPYLVKAIN